LAIVAIPLSLRQALTALMGLFSLTDQIHIPIMARPEMTPAKTMLPKIVDPRRLADQGATLKGSVAAENLPRISQDAVPLSEVQVELAFTRGDQGRIGVKGVVSGQFELMCQRCMDTVVTEVTQPVDLVVVWNDDQSRSVPRELDPWEVDEQANLFELIEDEILLALPLVAKHPVGQCQPPKIPEQGIPEPEEGRQKPFEILKELTKPSDK